MATSSAVFDTLLDEIVPRQEWEGAAFSAGDPQEVHDILDDVFNYLLSKDTLSGLIRETLAHSMFAALNAEAGKQLVRLMKKTGKPRFSRQVLGQINARLHCKTLQSGARFYWSALLNKDAKVLAASGCTLLELPALASARGKPGKLYLAAERQVDEYTGGVIVTLNIFTAHAVDRFAERMVGGHLTRTEACDALAMFSVLSALYLESIEITDQKNMVTAVKTPDGVAYWIQLTRNGQHGDLALRVRFAKTILLESDVTGTRREFLRSAGVTEETWSPDMRQIGDFLKVSATHSNGVVRSVSRTAYDHWREITRAYTQ